LQHNHHAQNRLRIGWTILVVILLVASLLSGCSGSTPKPYRVGILSGLDFFASTADSFKAEMTELGYVEGQNIVYDIQKTNFDTAAYKRILQQFVADKVDLILVFPTEASLEAKAATQGTNIPVVFASAFTEGMDLIKDVREPGGNITGVRYPGPDIALKRFEIMHEVAPQVKRIWIPYQRGYPPVPSQLAILRPAAAAAGVTLIELPASNVAELQADLQTRRQAADIGIDSIMFISEPLLGAPDTMAVVMSFAAEHKLPIGGGPLVIGNYGSLFSLTPNNTAVGKLAGILGDKIFKGTPAGTIPVFSPESELSINYKLAQELGLHVPEGLLRQATRVIH
jgi:putative tryptophan/tyrosine transport system substrate-binding protein